MQLAVIAKEPVPGRVKTRLCPPFSPEEAASLAAAALRDTLHVVGSTPASRHILVLDGRPGPWVPPGFEVIAQRGRGLAERLGAAFADCAAAHHGPVLLVGMDTPQLTPAALLHAGSLLATPQGNRQPRRAVIGPATDGGYWLIGLSHPDHQAFRRVPMSSSRTCQQQVRRLRQRGFEVSLTDELRDVDTVTDAAAVADLAADTEFARCFARLGDARSAIRS